VTNEQGGLLLICEELSWAGQQRHFPGRVEVQLTRDNGAWCWRVQAFHNEPIKSIKLLLWGLPDETLAKGWWSPSYDQKQVALSSPNEALRWRYFC